MDCEKILNLFRSELITVNVGPKLLATSLEMQEILDLLGGVD